MAWLSGGSHGLGQQLHLLLLASAHVTLRFLISLLLVVVMMVVLLLQLLLLFLGPVVFLQLLQLL
jgi:hypothetical protein